MIITLILIISVVLFIYDLVQFDGYYLDMDWYERPIVKLSIYPIFPLRYIFDHVVLSMGTDAMLYDNMKFSRILKSEKVRGQIL